MSVLVHTCHFRFGSQGDLEALPDAVGWSTEFTVGGSRVKIRLPGFEDRLSVPSEDTPSSGVLAIMRVDDEPRVFAIDYFTVTVEFDVDVNQAARDGDSENEDFTELHRRIDEADALAVETAARMRRWLFIDQPTFGPSEELPPRVRSERIKEKTTGREILSSPSIKLYGSMTTEETAVRLEALSQLGSRLAAGEEPPAPETLLAQARSALLHRMGRTVQPELAVLLAAVASEVKAKRVWEAVVVEESRPLLALMLANPRAFPQTAIDLFDKVALAVSGRSFREENRDSFRKLTALFELRNRVAHAAAAIDEQVARIAVLSVPPAFAWLEEVAAGRAR